MARSYRSLKEEKEEDFAKSVLDFAVHQCDSSQSEPVLVSVCDGRWGEFESEGVRDAGMRKRVGATELQRWRHLV